MWEIGFALLLSLIALSAPNAKAETQETAIEKRVTAVFGTRKLASELSPSNVVAKLRPLVEVQGQREGQQGLEFSGSGADVRWAVVTFYPGEKKGSYSFQSLQVGLTAPDEDVKNLELAVRAALQKKLGKGKTYDQGWRWRLGRWDLLMNSGAVPNPLSPTRTDARVVYIELSPMNED